MAMPTRKETRESLSACEAVESSNLSMVVTSLLVCSESQAQQYVKESLEEIFCMLQVRCSWGLSIWGAHVRRYIVGASSVLPQIPGYWLGMIPEVCFVLETPCATRLHLEFAVLPP